MNELTFEQLPKAVGEIRAKIDSIEQMLREIVNRDAPQSENEYITVKQVAELLCLSVQTIYGFTSKMSIPYYKRGQRLYFSRQEINEWIQSGRRKIIEEIEREADNYLIRRKRRY